jgi:hypothetical protein
VISTDPEFKPHFTTTKHSLVLKLASLKNFAIYVNTNRDNSRPMAFVNQQEFAKEMRITMSQNIGKHQVKEKIKYVSLLFFFSFK